MGGHKASRPRVAFFDFASCEGCQLTVVDSLQRYPDLLEAVEIVQFREAMSERGEDYQVAFVEGSCTRPSDEARLLAVRKQAKYVVALGACAHIGGVNAGCHGKDPDELRRRVYGPAGDSIETGEARPIGSVIDVDAVIPGCPIDRDEFIRGVRCLLQGRLPRLPDTPVCYECKLRENECLIRHGQVCLGPITRAGCGALCPTYGTGCEACRGLVPDANQASLRTIFAEHGLATEASEAALELFLRRELAVQEV
ncbi:MAG TPA: hypothetical protein VLL77_01985 [Anaerolineales bacterium]|nr:hypothetical protein [Anaerolineales bacterium]